jgi:phosphohistidine phosphatase
MVKRLIIVRHAKSDWTIANQTDFERVLNPRGKANAPEMALRLKNKGIVAQLILSSPAKRALKTAKYFAETWQIPITAIQKEITIYEANVNALLQVVTNLNSENNVVALFGHNPGLTDFCNYLSPNCIYNLPTCGIVIFDFEVDNWSYVSQNSGKLVSIDYPKSGQD